MVSEKERIMQKIILREQAMRSSKESKERND
jgi:hypothetical protein